MIYFKSHRKPTNYYSMYNKIIIVLIKIKHLREKTSFIHAKIYRPNAQSIDKRAISANPDTNNLLNPHRYYYFQFCYSE